MYSALPSLLDGNPFTESGQLRVPDGLGGILEVLKETLKLLTAFQVHPDISSQLCAYLFFFINASLFNALMDRGKRPWRPRPSLDHRPHRLKMAAAVSGMFWLRLRRRVWICGHVGRRRNPSPAVPPKRRPEHQIFGFPENEIPISISFTL